MSSHAARSSRSPLAVASLLAIGLAALLVGMLALFAWPAARSAPKDLPVVVAGPAPAVAALGQALAQAQPGAFAVQAVASREAAEAQIRDQQAYGGLVFGPSGAEVLVSSARSPAVAQALTQLGTTIGAARQVPVRTTDVVPLTTADPRGTGLVVGLLPIVLGGLAFAAASTALLSGRVWRLVAALAFALVGGLAIAVLLQSWLGTLQGSLLANAGVLALGIAAVSLAVLGLESVLGAPGLAVGALLVMLFGNALSAANSAPELLPAGWGTLGQLLPPGAINTALRSVAFFDGAGAARPLVVLSVWAAGGLALALLPRRTGRTGRSVDSDGRPELAPRNEDVIPAR